MNEKSNHCIVVNFLSVCLSPNEQCYYYHKGYADCFYHLQNRCCHSSAIFETAREVGSISATNPALTVPKTKGGDTKCLRR